MASYRLPSPDPSRFRWLLDELPPRFVARLQAGIGHAIPPGLMFVAHVSLVAGIVVRREDGYFVELMLSFAPLQPGEPAPAAEDIGELLRPLLAMPVHPEPPKELVGALAPMTCTIIR